MMFLLYANIKLAILDTSDIIWHQRSMTKKKIKTSDVNEYIDKLYNCRYYIMLFELKFRPIFLILLYFFR